MNQCKLAEARRLYHHVCQGGTITPEDVSFMVVALEEAYEREWGGLTTQEIDEIADRIKGDELLSETSTWHIRFAQAVQRNLKEKNT